MRQLILVKHASPAIVLGKSTDQWPLSEKGRAAAAGLVRAIKPLEARVIVSSHEPKAQQTAQIIADGLGLKVHARAGLHEHERRTVPHLRTADFLSLMAQVFKRKGEVVLGEESAEAALERFREALEQVVSEFAEGNLVVVAHGTVIALLLESISGEDGYRVWREMGLPSYAVVELPEWKLKRIVPQV